MQIAICDKHHKKEKLGPKLFTNSNICMSRYCPNSLTVMCSLCKTQHRDHSIKIITLEDIKDLVNRLLKTPFTLSSKYITQSIDVMKKIKLIKQYRRKIDLLENDILKQASAMIELTQTLIHQYALCKESVTELSIKLAQIETAEAFKKFKNASQKYLCQIDYNFKKDRMQFGNNIIKQKQDRRKKTLELTRRKIEEVKDYSMKIIEVILHNDSDSDGQQSTIIQKKKCYSNLKKQLNFDVREKGQEQQDQHWQDQMHSKSTTVSGNLLNKTKQTSDISMQTEDQWIIKLQQEIEKLANDLEKSQIQKQANQFSINELKQQVSQLQAQKEYLMNQVTQYKQKLIFQKDTWKKFSQRLKENRKQRKIIEEQKQKIYNKLITVYTTK